MTGIESMLRNIPAIDKLIAVMKSRPDCAGIPHGVMAGALREAAGRARSRLRQGLGADTTGDGIIAAAKEILHKTSSPNLTYAVNATGVILHTNLGRAPLSERARERITAVAEGYSTLEYDSDSGARGSRYLPIMAKIAGLTGAEDAIAVNNNAAAVLLTLAALTAGREVIVSRGQLVEIGGSFRIPDVMRQSGASLVEVGTTNKTHLSDYEEAIGPNTGAILKVHTSNYRIIGFVAQPRDEELAGLAARYNLPLIDDAGSGMLLPAADPKWQEATIGEKIAAGADVVTFSGDKLLGAGQAGIIAGKKKYLEKIKKHPLLRAVRIDKLSLAALEGTLLDYLIGTPLQDVPVLAMLNTGPEELHIRAEKLAGMLKERLTESAWEITVRPITSQAGGGSLPAVELAGFGAIVRHRGMSAAKLAALLRQSVIPVVARVEDDCVLLDVRCLTDKDMDIICRACQRIGKGAEK